MNNPPSPPRGGYYETILGMKELEKTMYFGARPETLAASKILRRNMTFSEKLLWERLNQKKVIGVRFRRQHPNSFFIADFYCHETRLVIELDGEIHNQRTEYDDGRSAEMEKHYIKVIRFTNSEVEHNMEEVLKRIEDDVKRRIKSPPGGFRGGFTAKLESRNKESC
jgi:very-short-patch-repair endonuclease